MSKRDPRQRVAKWCIAIFCLALIVSASRGILFAALERAGLLTLEPIEEYVSPDGTSILATYYIHQTLAPETNFFVSVRPASAPLKHRHYRIVAAAEHANAVDVIWKSPTEVVVTFVRGFGYYDSPPYDIRPGIERIGNIQADVRLIGEPQVIEGDELVTPDPSTNSLILFRTTQHQSGTPSGWKTIAKLSLTKLEGGRMNSESSRVLTLDGQFDVEPSAISMRFIVLTLPAEAQNAELDRAADFMGIPIKIVYAAV